MSCPADMTDGEYRRLQIGAVSNNTGSSFAEVQLQAIATYAGIIACQVVFSTPSMYARVPDSLVLVSEIVALLGGLLVSFTYPRFMPLWIACNLLVVLLVSQDKIAGFARSKQERQELDRVQLARLNGNRKNFITVYRSAMLAVVVFGILAVDFNIFDRRFAKTETFGISTMDAGVGAFILSNSIVMSCRPNNGVAESVWKIFKSSLPLIIVGIGRCVSVKSLDYQEHVSEYGVHWNFFFTLFFVGAAANILQVKIRNYKVLVFLGVVLASGYEYVLSFLGGKEYILEHPRTNLVHANKEGICSIVGYTGLYLIGAGLGRYLNQKRASRNQWTRTWLFLVGLNVFLWVILLSLDIGLPSRRMINLPYVLWALASSMTVLTLLLTVDLYVVQHPITPSKILSSINRNMLPIFLLANVLTGIINKSIRTLCVPDDLATVILVAYMCTVLLAAGLLHKCNITLKL
eukprot:CFRG0418T1